MDVGDTCVIAEPSYLRSNASMALIYAVLNDVGDRRAVRIMDKSWSLMLNDAVFNIKARLAAIYLWLL